MAAYSLCRVEKFAPNVQYDAQNVLEEEILVLFCLNLSERIQYPLLET